MLLDAAGIEGRKPVLKNRVSLSGTLDCATDLMDTLEYDFLSVSIVPLTSCSDCRTPNFSYTHRQREFDLSESVILRSRVKEK